MKKIILPKIEEVEVVSIEDARVDCNPVFVKESGAWIGMVVQEDRGWIVRVGGGLGAYGYHKTVLDCITVGMSHGYEFYTP